MKRLLGVFVIGLVVLPAVARAQDEHRTQFAVGLMASQQIVQSRVEPASSRLTGPLLGLEGALMSDRFTVRLRYGEGRVKPQQGAGSEARDVVEGEALVGFRAFPWLTLWGGPSARAYTMGSTDQRWLIWTARATGRGTLLPGRMQSFVELWGAFTGSVGDPALPAGGRGFNGGLEVRLGQSTPMWSRLSYKMESTHASGLRETVESLTLSLMYGLPQ
jgi:hypothetical protein